MNQQLITALYCRLSIEDDNDGDSNSIQNQRILLSTYANEQKFPNQRFFVDDGYTGTNFDRPAMQELLALVDAGEVGIICVKDLSRFGRDYLTVGNYLERTYYPQTYRVRVGAGVAVGFPRAYRAGCGVGFAWGYRVRSCADPFFVL